MNFRFSLTDYRIRSLRIFRGTLIAYGMIHLAMIIAEYLFDLKTTSFEVLVPTGIASLALIIVSIRNPESISLRHLLIGVMYVILEIHFIYNPRVFHVIGYWFPFIPMISLLLLGMHAAQGWFLVVILTHFVNALYLRGVVGGSYITEVDSIPFLATSVIYSISILAASFLLYSLLGEAYSRSNQENAELTALKRNVEYRRNLLERYLHEMISFSKNENNFNHGRGVLLKAICKTIVSTLDVSRASIWLMADHNTRLERQFQVESGKESGDLVILERSVYPEYFQALESKPFIAAPYARSNPETRAFTKNYLEPLDIISMLDCPILVDGVPVGVVCCEHQYHIKHWNAEDTLFVQSMSDFIAIAFKNERITNLLYELRRKNFELVEKNNEIEAMNEELNSLNEELTTVNETLEETVKRRTHELETQNNQLTEYAFINSHLLRAPLSRILGLSQLISSEPNSHRDTELINALISSTNELDAIIRRISEILYDGNRFTREDINEIIDRNLNHKKD